MKYYIVGEDLFTTRNYGNWILGEQVTNLKDADLVIFTGGEDVTPALYNEPIGKRTLCNYYRDKYERSFFKQAKSLKKKLLGICRGSQFLCVMSGGKLVQHQLNKYHYHWMLTTENKRVVTSSTHHQAQHPWNLKPDEFRVLAWTINISPFHLNGREKEIINGKVEEDKEIEVAFYPKTQALCIQGHPEMMFPDMNSDKDIKDGIIYFRDLVDKLMNDKL